MTIRKSTLVDEANAPRVALPNDGPEPFACESHPDRQTRCADARLVQVIEPDGTIWPLYLTDDGFTIGDMKVLITLCPECVAGNYTIERLSPKFSYSEGERQWGLLHEGTFIVDPRYDETYRTFEVDLAYYGLSQDERAQLVRLNRLNT